MHEDDLINQRLNWNFTIQGFLFGAYVYTAQKISELKISLLSRIQSQDALALLNSHTLGLRELRITMLTVALVGFSVSVFVYMSILAARMSIEKLSSDWEKLRVQYAALGDYLPGLVGGGDGWAHTFGFLAPKLLPIGFIVAWGMLILLWWLDVRV